MVCVAVVIRSRVRYLAYQRDLIFGAFECVKFRKIRSLSALAAIKSMMPKKDTTVLLEKLRSLMHDPTYVSEPISAYIVPSCDAHQSEYNAECDQRRAFLSGFTGSTGTAIVTEKIATLWTDGRYFLQAEEQLDSNWTLVKDGLPTSQTPGAWLNSVLQPGSRVGVDPFMIAAESWTPLATALESEGNALVPVTQNLVDLLWEDQPPRPLNQIIPLDLKYSGKSWQAKVAEVREKMKEKNASVLVVTALDEIAWLLNLRGSDIVYNPVFFAYAIITEHNIHFFVDATKLSDQVKKHLSADSGGGDLVIQFNNFESIKDKLLSLLETTTGKVWISNKSSYALVHMVPPTRLVSETNPIQLLKAVKNPTEIEGMRNCSIRDAVALCEYFAWLEIEVPKGNVTEVSGAKQLQEFRSQQDNYVGDSFATISSSGSHGAVIHYSPSAETDRPVTLDEMYLCDSGGQYLDGTTDVTRTWHFGTPTAYEKECFTRVLKGHITLSTTVFPRLLKGQMLDTLARTALWDVGLEYLHGTGHGVGAYLNVHEGPIGIGQRPRPEDTGIQENMILTDEPGYYEDGKFGCRIENVVLVVPAKTKFTMEGRSFLTFEPLTLVPIQTKLIDPSLLTSGELQWLNSYHARTRAVVGELMKQQGRLDGLKWLMKETQPLT